MRPAPARGGRTRDLAPDDSGTEADPPTRSADPPLRGLSPAAGRTVRRRLPGRPVRAVTIRSRALMVHEERGRPWAAEVKRSGMPVRRSIELRDRLPTD